MEQFYSCIEYISLDENKKHVTEQDTNGFNRIDISLIASKSE